MNQALRAPNKCAVSSRVRKSKAGQACSHNRLYACAAERDTDATGIICVVCAVCAQINTIDPYLIDHPNGWRTRWRDVAPIDLEDPRNEGARLRIIAGPSGDVIALARACLDELEVKRVVEDRDFTDEIAQLVKADTWRPRCEREHGNRVANLRRKFERARATIELSL